MSNSYDIFYSIHLRPKDYLFITFFLRLLTFQNTRFPDQADKKDFEYISYYSTLVVLFSFSLIWEIRKLPQLSSQRSLAITFQQI